jgi:hypothetical protein
MRYGNWIHFNSIVGNDHRARLRASDTALDALSRVSRDIFLRRFRVSKKDAQDGRVERASAIGRAHRGRGRGSIGRARTHIMRGRCSMRDISVRKRGKRMPCARDIERDCIDRAAPHGPLGKHMPCSQRARRNAQRCPRDLEATMDALAYRRPLAVAMFRWSPVSSFGYLCREERGAPWPPGRRQCGCRRARILTCSSRLCASPCQYALLTGAATERHRHAQDVLGWRAACSGEPV